MTFSLCNLLFLASTEDGSGPCCESAAWMEMAGQSISLARRMWRGENAKAALTFFFFPSVLHFYQEAGLSLIKVVRMGGIGVRRHCARASAGLLFQYCGWDLNRCWCEWSEGRVKVNNGGKSAQGLVLLIQCWLYFLFAGDNVLQNLVCVHLFVAPHTWMARK